jgi:type VI protein secretion system component Hcp
MANDDNSDILMFIRHKGKFLPGEGMTGITQQDISRDVLLKGYEPGQFFTLEKMSLEFADAEARSHGDRIAQAQGQQRKPANVSSGREIELQPVKITRLIDAASLQLLQYCYTSTTIDEASIVKRRASGGKVTGLGYIRFDFVSILITRIDWSDSHAVREDITFMCRKVSVKYSVQSATGKHVTTSPQSWSLDAS